MSKLNHKAKTVLRSLLFIPLLETKTQAPRHPSLLFMDLEKTVKIIWTWQSITLWMGLKFIWLTWWVKAYLRDQEMVISEFKNIITRWLVYSMKLILNCLCLYKLIVWDAFVSQLWLSTIRNWTLLVLFWEVHSWDLELRKTSPGLEDSLFYFWQLS